MDDLSFIKLFVEYGPYIAVYFFTDGIKRAFGIHGRWVWLTAFIVGWFLAVMQLIGLDAKLSVPVFIAKAFEKGLILGAVSISIRKMWTEKTKRQREDK